MLFMPKPCCQGTDAKRCDMPTAKNRNDIDTKGGKNKENLYSKKKTLSFWKSEKQLKNKETKRKKI